MLAHSSCGRAGSWQVGPNLNVVVGIFSTSEVEKYET